MKHSLFWLATSSAFTIYPALAEKYGSITNNSISDHATICMNVGFTASLTGLDDLVLSTNDESGKPGALYSGSDEFHLQANGPVSIIIKGGALSLGDYQITPSYNIDGEYQRYDTPSEGTHDSSHTLEAQFQIRSISAQAAGQYVGEIELIVVPQAGEETACGASSITYPALDEINGVDSDWATIAFEDLYPYSGDADYNDMVVLFNSQQNYNTDGELESIELNYIPVARGAGYNHEVHLDLDGYLDKGDNVSLVTDSVIEGGATVIATYTNLENGTSRDRTFDLSDDIPIFLNTRQTLEGFANVDNSDEIVLPREYTSVLIIPDQPELNLFDTDVSLDNQYRSYLYVNNTRSSIDLAEINSTDGMIDPNGYPFGIIVPDEWAWPVEQSSIDDAYPYFAEFRAWLAGETDTLSVEAEYWYLSPTTDQNLLFDLSSLPDFTEFISDGSE